MDSENEDPAEIASESIAEVCAGDESQQHPKFAKAVGVSTMIMALLSAVGALLAGISSNEILIERTTEIVERQNLVAARTQVELLETKVSLLKSLDKPPEPADLDRIQEYNRQITNMKSDSNNEEVKVGKAILEHEIFSVGVTVMSLAITLCGLAVLTHMKRLYHTGLLLAVVGAGFIGAGVYIMFW